ncbi:MAG TPA: VWA domain-containing protein [Polyangiales bacterium]|nr:VWA domain-containing protein [Polyangiales bacterium]
MFRSFGTSSRGRVFAITLSLALILGLGCDAERHAPTPRATTPTVRVKIEKPEEPAPPPADEKAASPQPAAAADARQGRSEVAKEQALSADVSSLESARSAKRRSGGEGAVALDDLVSGDALVAPSPASKPKASVGSLGTRGYSVSGGGFGSGYGAASGGFVGRSARMAASPAASVQMATPEMNTERYAHATDNTFQRTKDSPLSTFSIDVDTASYANVRRFLRDGALPPVDAVRIEELVNYFAYEYPEPRADDPVSVTTEVAAAPWAPDHRLVRVGLKTRAIDSSRAPASNLVFLIDVSGSMADPDKLPLLKRGLSLLAQNLRAEDRVAMVVYAGASGLVLPSTPGSQRAQVLEALDRLGAGGSTNGADGIRLAYQVARQHFVKGGTNRVILATDGDFNVGTTSEGELVRLIENERKSGVFLTVLGFGRGNLNDSSMEALADHGNGSYAYVDSIAEAHKVLVREAGSTLVTVAKDVKIQVEWNPTRVASYRLIGFENRVLAARDFNDDKKDAGELGAGHSMTALYEIVPLAASGVSGGSEVDPLKYSARAPTAAATSDEMLTLKIRYKRPDSDTSRLMTQAIRDTQPEAQASRDLRWAASVACFGMLLRNSEHKGGATLSMCDGLARNALGADPEGQRHEFVSLIDQAKMLGLGAAAVKVAAPSAKLAR